MDQATSAVEMIPVDRITVLNPRVRNTRIFREIVENIGVVGLKRPITVSRRNDPDGPRYELVCGQGRLEAYLALGQREIPAIVISADSEECLVMSLVENLARRQHRPLDLLRDITGLKQRGYAEQEIATKTGLSAAYVNGVIQLIEKGEQRLLRGVESGQIPLSVAVEIAGTDEEGVQEALQQAYEKKLLRGKKLIAARKLIEQRQVSGKGLRHGPRRSTNSDTPPSSAKLLQTFQEDADRKRVLIRKAELTRRQLLFVVEALRELYADENFVNLLRAEHMDSLPRNLAQRLEIRQGA